jgi:hypothetical protein
MWPRRCETTCAPHRSTLRPVRKKVGMLDCVDVVCRVRRHRRVGKSCNTVTTASHTIIRCRIAVSLVVIMLCLEQAQQCPSLRGTQCVPLPDLQLHILCAKRKALRDFEKVEHGCVSTRDGCRCLDYMTRSVGGRHLRGARPAEGRRYGARPVRHLPVRCRGMLL